MKKNLFFLFGLFLSLMFLISGCEPDPVTPMPTIKVMGYPLTPVYGGVYKGISTLVFSCSNTASISINGVVREVPSLSTFQDSISTGPLTNDKIFNIIATGPGGSATTSVTISPKKLDENTILLTQSYWYVTKIEQEFDNAPGQWIALPDYFLVKPSDSIYFTINQRSLKNFLLINSFFPPNSVVINYSHSGDWRFAGSQYLITSIAGNLDIVTFNQDTIILISRSNKDFSGRVWGYGSTDGIPRQITGFRTTLKSIKYK